MTNRNALAPGAELLDYGDRKKGRSCGQAEAAVAGKRKAATWKDDLASAAKAKARAAKTAIQPKPKASPGLEIESEV